METRLLVQRDGERRLQLSAHPITTRVRRFRKHTQMQICQIGSPNQGTSTAGCTPMTVRVLVAVVLHLTAMGMVCHSAPATNVTVFAKGEAGYYCIKIPTLFATKGGQLLAFAEARGKLGPYGCADWSATDLVSKRSLDGGRTWSPLTVVYGNSSAGNYAIVGNAVPLQLASGRILLPFCVNNTFTLQSFSDDDGVTWSQPRDFTAQVALSPPWTWIGLGPPGGLRLASGAVTLLLLMCPACFSHFACPPLRHSGRLVLPSYFSRTPNDNGELSAGLLIVSDDDGETWRSAAQWTFGLGFPNECQAVEVAPNHLYIHSRGLENFRIQAWSVDAGETVTNVSTVPGLVQPLEGCQGSTILSNGKLWYSGTNDVSVLRYNMSLFMAPDPLQPQFQFVQTVDPGSAAYSSLVELPSGDLGLLYEASNRLDFIFEPDHILFTVPPTT